MISVERHRDGTAGWAEVFRCVTAYEAAHEAGGPVALGEFLPQRGDPLFPAVLPELIRVELELGWGRGQPRRLDDYLREYPELADDRSALGQIAFEEYRLRRQAGEDIAPQEYERAFGVEVADWPDLPDAADDPPRPVTWQLRSGEAEQVAQALCRLGPEPAPERASLGAVLGELHAADPRSARRLVEAAGALPQVGSEFLGFRLERELGRGAFGTVYLAHQGDLADRPVALKVAPDMACESQALARLQHTNIVPIYSFHRAGVLQAVCMPYFGPTTLAHVLRRLEGQPSLPASGKELISTVNARRTVTRPDAVPDGPAPDPVPDDRSTDALRLLRGLSYVEAVLWVGARLADGLAHAHERGILHRDLKPANVLLADDGQPMLLDFNLAQDANAPGQAAVAAVGGTLPYMSPEQLQAYRGERQAIDARADVYSLGAILYELLTGRPPFRWHNGPMQRVLERMAQDRRTIPALSPRNPGVTPAVESIVRRCLDPDPARRYQSARQLQEDLERQLTHRRLRYAPDPSPRERARKWVRRHPRLTSTAGVTAVAAILLGAAAAASAAGLDHYRRLRAADAQRRFEADLPDVRLGLYTRHLDRPRLDAGLTRCLQALDRHGVLTDPDWQDRADVRYLPEPQRGELREGVGEVLFLLARSTLTEAEWSPDAPDRAARLDRAAHYLDLAGAVAGDTVPRALAVERARLARLRGAEGADRLLRDAEAVAPETARDCYLRGHQLLQALHWTAALPLLERATRLNPDDFTAWLVRGNCHADMGQYPEAVQCYTAAIALRPDFAPAWRDRGTVFARQRDYRHALADLDDAIRRKPDYGEAYINRATVRRETRDLPGAIDDLTRALELGAHTTRAYLLRADLRRRAGDAAGADRDLRAGLDSPPRDQWDWLAVAEARLPRDPLVALTAVEQALAIDPAFVDALQEKAHILGERLHKDGEALGVLDRAVELLPYHVPTRAGRGVALARLGRRDAALEDARVARMCDDSPQNHYQVGCIYALTAKQHPEDRDEAIRLLWSAMRRGFGLDIADGDSDLDPIRDRPEFRRMVAAARAIQAAVPR
jgi:serine/threonine protein kinase/Tfp pilus assembly protein PilF